MSEKHLSAIASKVGSDWEKLAFNLGLSRDQVHILKQDNPSNTENAIHSMLTIWSQGAKTQDRYEKAELLKSALEECGRKDVADKLHDLAHVD